MRILAIATTLACLGAPGLAAPASVLPVEAVDDALALARQAAQALAPAGARIEVVPGLLDSRLHLAPCARVRAWWPGGSRAWGRTRVGLRCDSGPTPWNVYLPLSVKVWAPALVGTAPLAAGTTLGAEHLANAVVDWAAEAAPPFVSADAVLGRTLARSVGAGEPLRQDGVRARQWFAAGDTVRIEAVGAGFRVVGEGQALAAGVEGQSVRVRTEGGRIVSGQPRGERRVEVTL